VRLPDPQRSYAVLIGTGTYRSDQLPDLPAVANNLQDLSDVLTDPALGGLPTERCVLVPDPSDPRTLFRTLRRYAVAAEDTFLVYFAGHGQTGLRNELYLSLAETVPDELKVSALAFDLLRDVLADCPAANRVVILDCCFSGRAIQDMAGEDSLLGQVGIEGTYVLTSTPVNAVALAPAGAAHTAFTGELLRLLRSGIPSGPEFLTYGEIYRQLLYTTTTRGLPVPRQRGTGTVDLLALSRNPAVSAATVNFRPVVPSSRLEPQVPQPAVAPPEPPWPDPSVGQGVRGGDPRLLRVAGRLFLLAMFLCAIPSLASLTYGAVVSDYSVVTSVDEWQSQPASSVVSLADITVPAFYLLAGVVVWRLCAQHGKAAWSGAAPLMVYGLDVAGGGPYRLTNYTASRFMELSGWDREVEFAGYVVLGVVLAAGAIAIVRMRPPLRLQRPERWRAPAAATALTLAAAGLYVSARLNFEALGWSVVLMWVVTGILTAAVPLAALLVRPVELASGLVSGWLAVMLHHEISFWSFRPSVAHAQYLWLGLIAVILPTVLRAYLNRIEGQRLLSEPTGRVGGNGRP